MMCYNEHEGAFDFTYKEFSLLKEVTENTLNSLNDEGSESNPHKYLDLLQLESKLVGILNLMDSKKEKKSTFTEALFDSKNLYA